MTNRFKKSIIYITATIALSVIAVMVYASDFYRADTTATTALQNSDNISVEITDDMAIFLPEEPQAGFIFYPGGKVEYTSYAPLMQKLAENGIACVITKMPLNLAVMDINAADKAVELLSDIDKLYIGGHSLGGSMAASYIDKSEYNFYGLVMLAAYSTADLTDNDIDVLLVSAGNDNVINHKKESKYIDNLPETSWGYHITGGNHAQFGSYGIQKGDGIATIPAEEQLQHTADAILEFMDVE